MTTPLRIVHPRSKETFVLLPLAEYERLKEGEYSEERSRMSITLISPRNPVKYHTSKSIQIRTAFLRTPVPKSLIGQGSGASYAPRRFRPKIGRQRRIASHSTRPATRFVRQLFCRQPAFPVGPASE
jgi:hypothetical protein